jgi:hypothetical protein
MTSIKSKVLDCLNSFDVYEVAIAINSATLSEFCDVINELLQSADDGIVSSTCGLIRDLVLFSNQHSDCETFSRNYETSSILQTIEQLLFSQNYFIRRAAVYTLGKTCSYSSVSILNQAFSKFRDSDPLLLPRLMGEMGWLGAENFWQLLDSMTESQCYMTRWAVVEILPEFLEEAEGQNELFLGKIRCLKKLRKDSNRHVQANSEYQYQVLKLRSEKHDLSKPDRKKMRKELERNYKQNLDFSYISNRFEYYLRSKNLTQYSMDDLEKFVEIINIVIDR